MKHRLFLATLAIAATSLPAIGFAQITPRTADQVQELFADGSIRMSLTLTFDASEWKAWRTYVGEDPARLRGLMRHQFAAFQIENFKMERDDLNRRATVSFTSPTGVALVGDDRFGVQVMKEFRPVSHTARDWFFSGNNPYAANSLNNVKIVLPAGAVNAQLVGEATSEQGVVYELRPRPGKARTLVWGGGALLAIGAVLIGLGCRRVAQTPPQAPAQPAA